MNSSGLQHELEDLKMQIKYYKDLYYQSGTSPLTDAEYDSLVARAEELGYVDTVGAEPSNKLQKVKHDHLMLSLGKTKSVSEIMNYFARNRTLLMMLKLDGLSLSATYLDGKLARLETRGDGREGNDVTLHAKSFVNLPLTISRPGKYVIDGECLILKSDFEQINSKLREPYSNPRNLAAGTLNLQSQAESAGRKLRFFVWDVIEYYEISADKEVAYHESSLCHCLDRAKKYGFDIVPYYGVENDGFIFPKNSILVDCNREEDEVAREELWRSSFDWLSKECPDIPIDGLVVRYNNRDFYKSLGYTGHHFKGALAYKFADDTYPTKLLGVEWQMGKTGVLTPVLNFEPCEIDGTIVQKCTAHNLSIFKELNLTEGCTVNIYKANQIIPICESAEDDGGEPIGIPEVCPICGGLVEVRNENGSETLVCTNPDCTGQLLGLLKHFVSRKGMDIDGLSVKTLSTLIKIGAVTKFSDIFETEKIRAALDPIPGFGRRSVGKLVKAIEIAKEVPLDRFICALSIPNVGTSQSRILADKFRSWDNFYNAVKEGFDFAQLEGFGSIANNSIHGWFANNDDIDRLVSFVNIVSLPDNIGSQGTEVSGGNTSSIYGKTFVITGKLDYGTRDEFSAMITGRGGKVASAVSRNTEYLINNDVTSTTGKNKKAKELGIPIISEAEFFSMFGE